MLISSIPCKIFQSSIFPPNQRRIPERGWQSGLPPFDLSSESLSRDRKYIEVLRSLRHHLRTQSQVQHTIDRLEERGADRGISARRPSLKGRERAVVNHTNIGNVSKATLGKQLRYRVERIWTFMSAYRLELN